MAKAARQHGFKAIVTLFAPYDPSNPESVTKAAQAMEKAKTSAPSDGVSIIAATDTVSHSIPGLSTK